MLRRLQQGVDRGLAGVHVDPHWTQKVSVSYGTKPHIVPHRESKIFLEVGTLYRKRPTQWKVQETCSLDFRGLALSVYQMMLAREVFQAAFSGPCRTVTFQATEDIKMEMHLSTWIFLGMMLNEHRTLNHLLVTEKMMYDSSVGGNWTIGFTDEGMSFEYHGPDVDPFFEAVAPELVHYGEEANKFRKWTALWEDVTTFMKRSFSKFVAKQCKDSGKRPIL
eukprot:SRR837773.11724.p1 GENE.SRR837773.11724~~SRR837773.11724.p1  ORF type:complete len:221 (-),score=37.52 SRR837773.11724:75-737(-)